MQPRHIGNTPGTTDVLSSKMLQKSSEDWLIRKTFISHLDYKMFRWKNDCLRAWKMFCISSLLVWESVQGGEVAWCQGQGPGGGHLQQAGEEAIHQTPGPEDPQSDDRGGHDGHGQGLQKLENLPHEGAQASAVLQDTKFTDCGVKDDLSKKTAQLRDSLGFALVQKV